MVANLVRNKKVGDKLHVRLLRGKEAKILTLTVGTLPDEEEIASEKVKP